MDFGGMLNFSTLWSLFQSSISVVILCLNHVLIISQNCRFFPSCGFHDALQEAAIRVSEMSVSALCSTPDMGVLPTCRRSTWRIAFYCSYIKDCSECVCFFHWCNLGSVLPRLMALLTFGFVISNLTFCPMPKLFWVSGSCLYYYFC